MARTADSVRSVIKSSIFGFFLSCPGANSTTLHQVAEFPIAPHPHEHAGHQHRALCPSNPQDSLILSPPPSLCISTNCKYGIPLECIDGAVLQEQLVTAKQCASNTRAHLKLLISRLRPLFSTRSQLLSQQLHFCRPIPTSPSRWSR